MPALFQAADQLSKHSQRTFMVLMFFNLFCGVLGAAAAIYAKPSTLLASVSASLLFISALLTGLMYKLSADRNWFDGRAIAESVKTQTWRYVTCAEPYAHGLPDQEVERKFIRTLETLLTERKHLAVTLIPTSSNAPQISVRMRQLRNEALDRRKALYLGGRIKDQRTWYSEKARANEIRHHAFLVLVFVCQALAGASAVYLVVHSDSTIVLAGFLATLASSLLAWTQLRQHHMFAISYALAAQELGMIAEQSHHVHTEVGLSTFVSNSENAISREHTLWLARKDRT